MGPIGLSVFFSYFNLKTFAWSVEICLLKVGWKYFTIKPGEQCAIMDGTLRTPTWLAASLDFRELLKYYILVPRLLEEEMDQYGWTTYSVLERRIRWQSVATEGGECSAPVITGRTLV